VIHYIEGRLRGWLGSVVAALALLGAGSGQAQPPAAAAPVETFFARSALSDPSLSPSGRWMALLTTSAPAGRKRLIILDLQQNTPPQAAATFERYDVESVRWVSDDYLIFSLSDDQERSSRNKADALVTVRRDGSGLRQLIKREWDTLFPARGKAPLEANFKYLALGAPGSNNIIVGESHYDENNWDLKYVTPYVLDVAEGSRRLLLKEGPPHKAVTGWVFDSQGRARLAYANEQGDVLYFYADTAGKWRQIGRFPALQSDFVPEYVDEQDRLIVSTRRDTDGVTTWHEFNLAEGKVQPQPILSTPGFDVDAWRLLDGQRRTVGYQVLTEGQRQVWLTSAMREVQQQVDSALPGRINLLQCRNCDAPTSVLVYSYSATSPGEILHFQPDSGKWERFGSTRSGIDESRMATMELVRTPARDGLELPVWITRPAGSEGKALPAVVLVHGGPWVRGRELEWDAMSQFLASRGYLVIEPEFRGSTGFGYKHFRAGWKQWGQKMQDDLADALAMAVEHGWADKSRVCIAGASYGGYATLMGLARQGDLFRCGIAWVAVTDPRLMFDVHWSDISQDSKRYTMPEMIGDPKADDAMLTANAPTELAAQIQRPLLLAYGARDYRVPIVHGETLQRKLAAAGRPPEWVVYDDEGHGWRRPQNAIDFGKRVERFLQRHLGAAAP